jgi:hypothetical protein
MTNLTKGEERLVRWWRGFKLGGMLLLGFAIYSFCFMSLFVLIMAFGQFMCFVITKLTGCTCS